MTAASLLASVETRIRQLTEQERRARFERETLTVEARRLRNDEAPELVLTRLRVKGIRIAGEAGEQYGVPITWDDHDRISSDGP